ACYCLSALRARVGGQALQASHDAPYPVVCRVKGVVSHAVFEVPVADARDQVGQCILDFLPINLGAKQVVTARGALHLRRGKDLLHVALASGTHQENITAQLLLRRLDNRKEGVVKAYPHSESTRSY